eukprot:gene23050-30242_t
MHHPAGPTGDAQISLGKSDRRSGVTDLSGLIGSPSWTPKTIQNKMAPLASSSVQLVGQAGGTLAGNYGPVVKDINAIFRYMLTKSGGGKGVMPGVVVICGNYSDTNLMGRNHKLDAEVELGQAKGEGRSHQSLVVWPSKQKDVLQASGSSHSDLWKHDHGLFGDEVEEPDICALLASGKGCGARDKVGHSPPKDDTQALIQLEQALPLMKDWPQFSRLRMRVEKPIPLHRTPLTLHLKARAGFAHGDLPPYEAFPIGGINYVRGYGARAGFAHGDLPPYEAFPIGGINYVRGYGEGDLGSSRHSVDGSAEVRFPVYSIVSGSVFADWGSDLRSGSSIKGNPAGVRKKPGRGHGYGGGVKIDSPLGPLRIEYAINALKMGFTSDLLEAWQRRANEHVLMLSRFFCATSMETVYLRSYDASTSLRTYLHSMLPMLQSGQTFPEHDWLRCSKTRRSKRMQLRGKGLRVVFSVVAVVYNID